MPVFAFKVQDTQGKFREGTLEAGDSDQAVKTLQGRGEIVLSIKPAKAGGKPSGFGRGGVANRDLVFFGEQVASLLEGGVPLIRALTLVKDQTANRALAKVLSDVCQDVVRGQQFSQALGKHPKIFSPFWIALVRTGEVTGQLHAALVKATAYLESQEELRGKVLTALMYPVILSFISLGALAFFILKIVPVFSEIFSSFELTLPPLTRAVVAVSDAVTQNVLFIVIGLIAAVASLRMFLATEAGRTQLNRFIFGLPGFGAFALNIQLEKFLSTLSTLVSSGVSILNALEVLGGLFSSAPVIGRSIAAAQNDIAMGKSISESFRKTGVYPSLVTEMMAMGEESGKLQNSLNTLARYYAKQIDQFIRRFTSIIDPVMVVFVGGIVGVIVLSVFMPIFKLSQIR